MPTFPTVHAAPYRYAPTNTSSRDQRNKMIKQNKSRAAPAPRPCDKTMSCGNTISVITPILRSCTIGKKQNKIRTPKSRRTEREIQKDSEKGRKEKGGKEEGGEEQKSTKAKLGRGEGGE